MIGVYEIFLLKYKISIVKHIPLDKAKCSIVSPWLFCLCSKAFMKIPLLTVNLCISSGPSRDMAKWWNSVFPSSSINSPTNV